MALLIKPLLNSAWRCGLSMLCALVFFASTCRADEALLTGNEKELKVAFLYNFALFTEWPSEVGNPLNLCILGADTFGKEISALQGKLVDGRSIAVLRKGANDSLRSCHLIYVGPQAIGNLSRVLDEIRDLPVLTVADTTGAARQGVALNMQESRNKISFEANLHAVRSARLKLSSKLLRLATEVYQ